MNAEENPSSKTPAEHKPSRVEDILLDRLQNEPKIRPQIATPLLFAIIIGVLALGIAIYFISKKPEKFAENPHKGQTTADSSTINSKRLKFGPMLDSLQKVITANPNDDNARLMIANVYYECEYWDRAKSEYELYLSRHEDDVDARVDYAITLAEASGDFKAAMVQLNKALSYDPEHLNALFNAGLLSIQANLDDKQKAISIAKGYFSRALAAAKKQGNDKMAEQIGKILKEIEKPGEKSEP